LIDRLGIVQRFFGALGGGGIDAGFGDDVGAEAIIMLVICRKISLRSNSITFFIFVNFPWPYIESYLLFIASGRIL